MSDAGIYHGTLTFKRRKPGDSAIKDAEIIQFDNKTSAAISIAITEFHTIVAFPDKLQIFMQPPGLCSAANDADLVGISQVSINSLKIVFQENYSLQKGKLLGLAIDETNSEIYAYTDSSIHKIEINEEERNVWRLYLEQTLDPKTAKEEYFNVALRLCRDDPETRSIVLTAKADYYFKIGQYKNAANVYAKTLKSFEEVALMFSSKGQKDALRIFLLSKLKFILSRITKENEGATQLSCLCTWLTEMYLDKMNELIDQGDKAEFETIKTEFRQFLEVNRKYLNRETTFTLISSHGHVQEALYYAMLIEDYERVISHHITEGNYTTALDILNRFCKSQTYEEYFYKFAPILMEHLPKQTVDALISGSKRFLNPARLIPALMRYIATRKPDDAEENHVIRYLEWCVKRQNEDPAIHNLLLSLYADLDDSTKLLQFLNTDGENNFYDTKYALRICTEKGKTEACVRLYSSIGLYEDAVELSLSVGEITLARECADKPEDGEMKKKMWLKIAKHVIQQQNVKEAINFLSYTDKIKLEDILPYFPDFVLIDDFREEICKSLEEYKNEIEELKTEMKDATENAELIRNDIKELKHRYGYIPANAKCNGANCFKNILAKEFYLFPCQHMFHVDCLVEEIQKHVTKSKGARITELYAKYKRLQESGQLNSLSFTAQPSDADNASPGLNVLREEMRELDDILSTECPFCGEIMINSIDAPFISENDEEIESWSLRSIRVGTEDL